MKKLRFGSVCSGIEAASVAWHQLGMEAAWVSEVDPYCKAVLAHRWPGVPDLGDITDSAFMNEAKHYGPVDLVVGGTPCQAFSTAGLRGGYADPRGRLTLRFLDIVGCLQPSWVVWENVPGVLSSSGGRDLAAFLAGLEECGYRWAFRVLDARHFGVPQRRRRLYVVGHLGGDGAERVLFEREGGFWDPAACGEERRANPPAAAGGPAPEVPMAFYVTAGSRSLCEGPLCPALKVGSGVGARAIAGVLDARSDLRKLTPREWERLQGFPDDYTLVPYGKKGWAGDNDRFGGLGNSMAVPVMRWIGRRLLAVESEACVAPCIDTPDPRLQM